MNSGIETHNYGSLEDSQFNGMWLWGSHMNKTNLTELKLHGIDNIIIHEDAFTRNSPEDVVKWINEANSKGIKIHIWIQCFYKDGNWIKPVLENGSFNRTRFDEIIVKAVNYSKIANVTGIHLDYLRYGGKAFNATGGYENACDAISSLVSELKTNVTSINPNIILSAAVMPELENDTVYFDQNISSLGTYADEYYYGQNISSLGTYLDYLIPMIYKGNYNKDSSWIGTTTNKFTQFSPKAKIIAGLQAYVNDDDPTPLPPQELAFDANIALSNGAYGVCFFRFGLFNYIDDLYELNSTDDNTTQIQVENNPISEENLSNGDNFTNKTGFPLIILLLLICGLFYGLKKNN
jgi:hypothetical protein